MNLIMDVVPDQSECKDLDSAEKTTDVAGRLEIGFTLWPCGTSPLVAGGLETMAQTLVCRIPH